MIKQLQSNTIIAYKKAHKEVCNKYPFTIYVYLHKYILYTQYTYCIVEYFSLTESCLHFCDMMLILMSTQMLSFD